MSLPPAADGVLHVHLPPDPMVRLMGSAAAGRAQASRGLAGSPRLPPTCWRGTSCPDPVMAPWAAVFKISKVPLPTNILPREVAGGGKGREEESGSQAWGGSSLSRPPPRTSGVACREPELGVRLPCGGWVA